MKIQELAARIKWKPVIGLIAVIALLMILIWAASNLKLSSGFKGDGDIQMRAWADPSKALLTGKGKVWVDVRNTGTDNINANVNIAAYSKSLVFSDSGTQQVNKAVEIGPGESRQLDFLINFNASDAGKYGLKVTVSPGDLESEVFFDLAEK